MVMRYVFQRSKSIRTSSPACVRQDLCMDEYADVVEGCWVLDPWNRTSLGYVQPRFCTPRLKPWYTYRHLRYESAYWPTFETRRLDCISIGDFPTNLEARLEGLGPRLFNCGGARNSAGLILDVLLRAAGDKHAPRLLKRESYLLEWTWIADIPRSMGVSWKNRDFG